MRGGGTPRRPTLPFTIETLGDRRGMRRPREVRERRPAGSCGSSWSADPWRGGNPREPRGARRDHSAVRTTDFRREKGPEVGRGARGRRVPFELTTRGQERAERCVPSPRRGKLRRANPSVRGMKQGRGVRGRSKPSRGLTNPEDGTDWVRQTRESWALTCAGAIGNETPREGLRSRETQRPVAVKTLEGIARPRELEAEELKPSSAAASVRKTAQAILRVRPERDRGTHSAIRTSDSEL